MTPFPTLPIHSLPARRVTLLVAAFAATSLLSGCSLAPTASSSSSTSSYHLAGQAKGGQQPVSGATIQLYAAGSGGNASAATPLLTSPVLTDSNGNFSITGDYTCPAATTQVYITATGGNPGLPPGSTNPALALLTVLGDCSTLATRQSVTLNEVTTAAAAYALAPFASSISSIGASPTNLAGLRAALATAAMLADTTAGLSPGAGLPPTATVETAKLYTLADILASCTNSDGTSTCSQIFSDVTPPGAPSSPSDTFQAALFVATYPGNNVAGIFNDTPPQPLFSGALTSAPSDWSMSIAFTGGGIANPASVAIDSLGNAWVAGSSGTLSGFSSQGVPLSPAGYTGSSLYEPFALAIDATNNIWLANQQSGSTFPQNSGSVVEFSPSGTPLSGPTGYTNAINQPYAVAPDTQGHMWVLNFGSASVSILNSSGNPIAGGSSLGVGTLSQPYSFAIDAANTAWITSLNTSTLTHLSQTGSVLGQVSCCTNASVIALDSVGNLWAANSGDSHITRVSNLTAQTPTTTQYSGGGLNSPIALAFDGQDHLWITNGETHSISKFAGTESPEFPGRALSPATGFGLDAGLLHPYGAAVDSSGNLWVSSYSNNKLVKFVGLATPIQTPTIGLPVAP